jgi:hypothetical protein
MFLTVVLGVLNERGYVFDQKTTSLQMKIDPF